MAPRRSKFHVVLIKPTRYDDAGYPIHWTRSPLPSNALACMYGIVDDCRRRQVLGPDVDIEITAIDESNFRVRVPYLVRKVQKDGGRALVGMVGVQSNQYPRALDLALQFRQAGLQVAIGGFHVSGCIAMLDELTPELKAAQDAGISLFSGEAEEQRLDEVLRDAWSGALKPHYDYAGKAPPLEGQPLPLLPAENVSRTLLNSSSFDLGRGCPFECSFCCIINVQGRKSRYRTPDELETIVRANVAMGIHEFFITDDNLARNKQWEPLLDRLIVLRDQGIKLSLQIQVDTLTHRIPGFIDKAVRAGVDKVFVGLENINPENLAHVKKRQNRITEYRDMLLAWKRHPVVITCGYIIGFPKDTRASILHDIDILKRELPIDILYLTMLTPLPGSEDHKRALASGTWMDPDLNKYDLCHRVIHHPLIPDDEYDRLFAEAWQRFYTPDHVERVLRRAAALGSNKKITTANRLFYYGRLTQIYGEYTIDMGLGRRRYRADRRPGLPRESLLAFSRRVLRDFTHGYVRAFIELRRHQRQALRIWADPNRHAYKDLAITPTGDAEFETLEMYRETRGGAAAVAKHRANTELRLAAAQARTTAAKAAETAAPNA
ncbi:MAG: radical SAM protein [Hyphomicrobiaceae bacterium]|nr:radical SAM protein [Hyphomicrobiaceae bacterium]